jgi:hypothetical protein
MTVPGLVAQPVGVPLLKAVCDGTSGDSKLPLIRAAFAEETRRGIRQPAISNRLESKNACREDFIMKCAVDNSNHHLSKPYSAPSITTFSKLASFDGEKIISHMA